METMGFMGMDMRGLEELAVQLAKELLARKGYDVIGGDWMLGHRGLVARDGDCLVFADVAPDLGVDCGFEPIDIDRDAAEGAAFAYLSGGYGGDDAEIRFDAVKVKPLPNGKAFAKHVVNALGAGA